ncbi:MAG: hypothetical protein GHHEDOFH_02584 [Pseudorhodoplanes sp.]|nr:hypothetical protein [Pseudorhodoplanes sp.]
MNVVMPGLDPGIHHFLQMGRRVGPGDDKSEEYP